MEWLETLLQDPIRQLLDSKQWEKTQEITNGMKDLANNTNLLDNIIKGLNTKYETQQLKKVAILYILVDEMGVCLFQRLAVQDMINKFVQLLVKPDLTSMKILKHLVTLLRVKYSPFKKEDINELYVNIIYRSTFFQLVDKLESIIPDKNWVTINKLKYIQSVEDSFALTLTLIITQSYNELSSLPSCNQLDEMPTPQEDTSSNQRVNEILGQLWVTGDGKFCLLQFPYQANIKEKRLKLFSLLQKTQMEIDKFLNQNNVTNVVSEMLITQQRIIKDILEQMMNGYTQLQQLQNTEPLNQRTSFQQGERLSQDENQIYEFKNYSWPFESKAEIILSVICSFLNTKGGYIFFGIHDEEKSVQGMKLNSKERDEFKLFIQNQALQLKPKPDLVHKMLVQSTFLPVKTKDQENKPGVVVVRVTVQQGDQDRFYTYLDQTKQIVGQYRLDGRKQSYYYPDIVEQIYKQSKNPREKSQNLPCKQGEIITDENVQEYWRPIRSQSSQPYPNAQQTQNTFQDLQFKSPYQPRQNSLDHTNPSRSNKDEMVVFAITDFDSSLKHELTDYCVKLFMDQNIKTNFIKVFSSSIVFEMKQHELDLFVKAITTHKLSIAETFCQTCPIIGGKVSKKIRIQNFDAQLLPISIKDKIYTSQRSGADLCSEIAARSVIDACLIYQNIKAYINQNNSATIQKVQVTWITDSHNVDIRRN